MQTVRYRSRTLPTHIKHQKQTRPYFTGISLHPTFQTVKKHVSTTIIQSLVQVAQRMIGVRLTATQVQGH